MGFIQEKAAAWLIAPPDEPVLIHDQCLCCGGDLSTGFRYGIIFHREIRIRARGHMCGKCLADLAWRIKCSNCTAYVHESDIKSVWHRGRPVIVCPECSALFAPAPTT